MHSLDSIKEKNPNFFINLEDTEKLAEAMRRKGYDLPLVAVHCIYEVWSEETYFAGWMAIGDFDRSVDSLISWMETRNT